MRPPLDPILVHFTPTWGIHWYGILIVSGVMLGAVYAAWQARRDGEDPDHVWNGLIIAVILAIVLARLYHVFSEPEGGMVGWSYYRQHPEEIFYIWQGGLGIYGAIVGGVLGVVLYAWRMKLRPLQWLDYGAPGLAMGQVIGRWGNFMNQELYGPPTNLPWGLIIDPQHRIIPYNDLSTYPPDTLFHPTFLYESLWCLVLFIALALIATKLRRHLLPGDVLLGYIIGYPLGRYFVEFLRPDAWMIGPIAAAQLFAIICVAAGTAVLVVRHLTAKPGQQPATPAAALAAASDEPLAEAEQSEDIELEAEPEKEPGDEEAVEPTDAG